MTLRISEAPLVVPAGHLRNLRQPRRHESLRAS